MFETLMDFVDNDYAIHTMDRPIVSTKLQTELHDILKKKIWGKHSLICFMTNNYM